jgi:hypothetical protein
MVNVFYDLFENRTMKPVEIIFCRGRGMRENDGGDEPTKVYCKYIWKCHSEIPYTTNIC